MARVFLILFAAQFLTGCGLWPDRGGLDQPYVGAAASLDPTPVVRILVSLDSRDEDARSVESIELIAPDGERYSSVAADRQVTRQPFSYTALPGLRGRGGVKRSPSNLSLIPPSSRRGHIVSTTAVIEIPDIAAYRRMPERWMILVVLADTRGKRTRIARPGPPIEAPGAALPE